jgi:hypothetical protein
MTINAVFRRQDYIGDGTTTEFAVPFQFYNIDVYVDGAIKTAGADYEVVQPAPGGEGTVIFDTAPSAEASVIINGNTHRTQQVDYVNNDDFPAEILEQALDRLTMIAQELDFQFVRSIRAPITTDNVPELDFAANPLTVLRVDAGGVPYLGAPTDLIDTIYDAIIAARDAALVAETNAETAEANAETAEASAEAAQAAAEAARDAAIAARDAAQLAETNAETAETNAETAEANAEAAQAAAEVAEVNAEAAATNAAASASAAAGSALAALASENAAELAETNAETAETNAEAAQAAAEAARDAAQLAETNAETAETNAEAAQAAAEAAQAAAEAALATLGAVVVLKGGWDASSGSFPGSGAAVTGWSYIVTTGGTVDGVVFTAGDRIIAVADNASTTTFAGNWFKADYTDQVLSVAGKTGAVTLVAADISDTSANGQALITAAHYAAMRALLDLEAGTDFYSVSAADAKFVPDGPRGVNTLTDAANISLNAALGNVFIVTCAGDRTLDPPSNPTAGQKIIIVHVASGADRSLTLSTGTGGFRFGTDIGSLTATVNSKADYIGCVYSSAANKWDVIAYAKGY